MAKQTFRMWILSGRMWSENRPGKSMIRSKAREPETRIFMGARLLRGLSDTQDTTRRGDADSSCLGAASAVYLGCLTIREPNEHEGTRPDRGTLPLPGQGDEPTAGPGAGGDGSQLQPVQDPVHHLRPGELLARPALP